MQFYKGIRTFYPKTRLAWRKWLQTNHEKEQNVWLIIDRKLSGKSTLDYEVAVQEALCYGWIDSRGNKRDEESFYMLFARRNPKSKWSKINKERVDLLHQQKLLKPPGLAAIAVAKENGSWDALNTVDNLEIPDDLQKAFDQNKMAAKNFLLFPASGRKMILEWILNAKRMETRIKRIEETVTLAEKNLRANQYVPKNIGSNK